MGKANSRRSIIRASLARQPTAGSAGQSAVSTISMRRSTLPANPRRGSTLRMRSRWSSTAWDRRRATSLNEESCHLLFTIYNLLFSWCFHLPFADLWFCMKLKQKNGNKRINTIAYGSNITIDFAIFVLQLEGYAMVLRFAGAEVFGHWRRRFCWLAQTFLARAIDVFALVRWWFWTVWANSK